MRSDMNADLPPRVIDIQICGADKKKPRNTLLPNSDLYYKTLIIITL
jgi:hypothetical protein